ncbi:hypothetical protein WMF04_07620 [Sorangium sp. So ce260]|uniref:hypothetical protein n=1 Tax=Sorangium sp. So ce260 TaxID=3133291 RepID=UPI003F5E7C14
MTTRETRERLRKTCGALAKEPELLLVGDRQDADDDPRVQGDEVELLGRAEEEVQVLLRNSSKYFWRTFASAFGSSPFVDRRQFR